MAAPKQGSHNRGFEQRKVIVLDVDREHSKATVRDEFGHLLVVMLHAQRAKGALPQPNELWFIDRTYGDWTLSLCLSTVKPRISGAAGSKEHLVSLTNALVTMGFVDDLTSGHERPWADVESIYKTYGAMNGLTYAEIAGQPTGAT